MGGWDLEIFDRLESLLDAGEPLRALTEVRALAYQFESKSEIVSGAFNDFLIDLMTLVFVAEAYGNQRAQAAHKLARRRLSKVRVLSRS